MNNYDYYTSYKLDVAHDNSLYKNYIQYGSIG